MDWEHLQIGPCSLSSPFALISFPSSPSSAEISFYLSSKLHSITKHYLQSESFFLFHTRAHIDGVIPKMPNEGHFGFLQNSHFIPNLIEIVEKFSPQISENVWPSQRSSYPKMFIAQTWSSHKNHCLVAYFIFFFLNCSSKKIPSVLQVL